VDALKRDEKISQKCEMKNLLNIHYITGKRALLSVRGKRDPSVANGDSSQGEPFPEKHLHGER
jgi:hypothetical protein